MGGAELSENDKDKRAASLGIIGGAVEDQVQVSSSNTKIKCKLNKRYSSGLNPCSPVHFRRDRIIGGAEEDQFQIQVQTEMSSAKLPLACPYGGMKENTNTSR